MNRIKFVILTLILSCGFVFAQTEKFDKLNFILGDWLGTGSGFGNNRSKIQSGYHLIMDGQYIEVTNESKFEPTDKKPEGENHLDKGMISFDKSRKKIIFRQFNNEGFYNQYVLNDTISNDSLLVFETEFIENFVPNGKARWTIKKISPMEIETIFDVSFGKKYSCFGINKLTKTH